MSKTQSLVSVIIVNWNGRKWLEKCLDSLRAQTYRNFEIIFVDNASTDDSVEFVEKNYPEVIVVQSDKNLGFAGGNNLGIRQAKGDLLLLLNNDTWVENDFLEKMVFQYMKLGYDVIAPTEYHYDKKPLEGGFVMKIDPFGHPVPTDGALVSLFYLSGSSLLFSKEIYEETGGLDEDFFMYFEEVDWFWRLHLMKKTVFQCSDIHYYHAGAGSTGPGIKYRSFLWRNQNTLQMLLRNYSWHNLLWVLPVYFVQNLFEIFIFLIFLKPRIAWSYIEGWQFNLTNIKRTLGKRSWIQKHRKINDQTVLRKMYFGFGKVYHLLCYLGK